MREGDDYFVGMNEAKRYFRYIIFPITLGICFCSYGQEASKIDPLSKYENADAPVKLFPGDISVDGMQWNNAFTRDNRKIFYCQQLPNRAQLVYQEFRGKRFSIPEPIPFDTLYNYSDPYINAQGNHLIFMSNLPYHLNRDSVTTHFQLWQSHKRSDGWSIPEIVFPTKTGVGYPWRTKDGTLFYSLMPSDGTRNSNIYFATFKNGRYGKPMALPNNVNSTDKFEGDAFVAPNREYLIFAGFDREDSMGFSDLYITFNQGENTWSDPKSLGTGINSTGYDGSPFVTEDGKFLIFTSSRNSPGENSFFNRYIVRFHVDAYRECELFN
ncbi:hypothetical protein [Ulvibacterium sp.]|uniref:hypothetical protein n=1 Tax=Ulvibacterium sp. TaxID=2665914 RepID=UPI002621DE39|nr:hypothetical protein [Ulvibacterium sp.]